MEAADADFHLRGKSRAGNTGKRRRALETIQEIRIAIKICINVVTVREMVQREAC